MNTTTSGRHASAMSAAIPSGSPAYLVPVSGPELGTVELPAHARTLILGRHEACELKLPVAAEQVSRFHARLAQSESGQWSIADQQSRWGTFVNGRRLEKNDELPLSEGDLIRIAPWTFSFSKTAKKRGLQLSDDTGQTVVRPVTADQQQPLARELLTLLLEAAASVHTAADEKQLAQRVIEGAARGTGLQNAFVLRPLDTAGQYEVLASSMSGDAGAQRPTFSRSLLAGASGGQVVEVSTTRESSMSQSMVQLRITAAMCVPLMLGTTPAAFLYLDSRATGATTAGIRPDASAFATALGHIASMALANLKRSEMEKREAEMKSDLNAAAAAQQYILPARRHTFARIGIEGESRAGKTVGGDFFDVIELDESHDRIGFAVADVTGKGMAAGVLMSTTQGFFHSRLVSTQGDVAASVRQLSAFINPRRPANKFVTLWAGVIDTAKMTLTYTDAGHGFGILRQADGTLIALDQGDGLPVGIEPDWEYHAVTLPLGPGDTIVVVSDGIVEQFGTVTHATGQITREQFELSGVRNVINQKPDDLVEAMYQAVIQHAGTDQLADDATIIVVRVG